MKPALAPGDVLELRIEKAVYRGLGLARHEGCVVFVARSYAGERVQARVVEVGRGYARAVVAERLEASAARRAAPCQHAERCGGCVYQDLDYEEQLRVKEAILRESLSRARIAWDAAIPIARSPETGWRMRTEMHLDWSGPEPRLGFHEEGSHRVVDVVECLQLSPALNRAAHALRAALAARRPLAERVRSVEFAESQDGSRLVACLVAELDVRGIAALEAIARDVPALSGLLALPGAERGRPTTLLLAGSPFVGAEVAGLPLRAHQQSFFQSNRYLVEPLVGSVLELVPADGPLLDLYAGVGLFALPLARRGHAVVGVEVNPLAVGDARANAEAAGLSARFETLDVEAALHGLPARPGERIVLDPPRDGASRLALHGIAARRPESVTYVSCDPPTLGRDLNRLAELGYRLTRLEAFDMFPDTFHMESVAHLVPDGS